MMIALHKQARTTPAVRAEIAASHEPVAVLARRYHVTEATVRKWQLRTDFHDRPHTAHRLQTTLTPAQEAIVVSLRKALLLPLDDLLVVTREFLNPEVSRSGLDRCLRRHGVEPLRALLPKPEKAAHKPFKAYVPGLSPHRCQVLAPDGRRNPTSLPFRRHRPGHPMGVHRPQAPQDSSHRPCLPQGLA